jgi:anti-anti-sigma regulatory factor
VTDDTTRVAPGLLSLTVHPQGPAALLVVEGRLDADSSALLAEVLHVVIVPGRRPPLFRLEVDLGRGILADGACLAPLARARADLAARGGTLELRRPSRPFRRALESLGLGSCIVGPALEVVGRRR